MISRPISENRRARRRTGPTHIMAPPLVCSVVLLLTGADSLLLASRARAKSRVSHITSSESPQESLAPQLLESLLTHEEVATIPKPGSMGLGAVNFSPDDRYITYLGTADATSLTRQLFSYDRETGETKQVIGSADSEESFSAEEKLRRERQRIMSVGVTEYSWAKKANRILVPKDGALYVQDGVGDGATATLRRLFDPSDAKWAEVGSGAPIDAKLSDDGEQVFFVWDSEVCACDISAATDDDTCTPRRLTAGARDAGVTSGIADYCAQEEMNRYTGYWPSPGNGGLVAFEEADERVRATSYEYTNAHEHAHKQNMLHMRTHNNVHNTVHDYHCMCVCLPAHSTLHNHEPGRRRPARPE